MQSLAWSCWNLVCSATCCRLAATLQSRSCGSCAYRSRASCHYHTERIGPISVDGPVLHLRCCSGSQLGFHQAWSTDSTWSVPRCQLLFLHHRGDGSLHRARDRVEWQSLAAMITTTDALLAFGWSIGSSFLWRERRLKSYRRYYSKPMAYLGTCIFRLPVCGISLHHPQSMAGLSADSCGLLGF